MFRPPGIRPLFRFPWRSTRQIQRDVDAELAFHLESRIAELVAGGLAPEAAHAEALRQFGDLDDARRYIAVVDRDIQAAERRSDLVSDLWQDLVYAARKLRLAPAFTATAVLTLALGIGANAAIFSVVNAYLFRPMPVRDPDQLVMIGQTSRGSNLAGSVSYLNLQEIRGLRTIFADAVGWSGDMVSVRRAGGGDAEPRFALVVTGNFFTMLGVLPEAGRLFTERDAEGSRPVVVLSHKLWQVHYGGDPSIVGQTISLNGIPHTVTGIAPASFHGSETLIDPDCYVPLWSYEAIRPGTKGQMERRESSSLKIMARLQPGRTPEEARAALRVLAVRLDREYAELKVGLGFVLELERRARPEIAVAGLMPLVGGAFMALAGLVLLIACVNVANLTLARATARQPEMALRRALGASRGRLVRQLLTESVLLALAGLAAGLVLALWVTRWLSSIHIATDAPVRFDVAPDARVFGFAVVIALVAGLLTGIAPALQSSGDEVGEMLKEGGRGGGGGKRRSRLRSVLVVAQVAVSLVLLVCAGLFTRSVREAAKVDLGFRPDHLLLASTDVGLQRYDSTRSRRFAEQLLMRARALPGVRAAALADNVPLSGDNNSLDVYFAGDVQGVEDNHTEVFYARVTPDYLRAMALPLLEGREFTRFDSIASPRVAMINATMAKRFWPGGSAVGRHVRLAKEGPLVEVVGVVKESHYILLNETPRPFIYVPFAQGYPSTMILHVRTTGDPVALAGPVRDIMRDLDRGLPVFELKTMQTHLHDGIAYFFVRLAAVFATAIGVLGVVQTLVGLYGVLSYGVSQRTREIGIRMALGARGRDVLGQVLAQGLLLAIVGVAIGAGLSLAVTRGLAGLLVGVGATDVATLAGASLFLIALALGSIYLPARRASRIEPAVALRSE